MSKRRGIVLALPPGVNWADIEFLDEAPLKRKLSKMERDQIRRAKNKRHRQRQRKNAWAKRKVAELAKVIATDLLEMRAERNEQAIARFRVQQAREAKAFAEKLTAQFRNAVKKAAENAA